ncbi:PWWP domain-containing protein 2A isoform X2 [Protopterus annectens]|uniref:PWWP domain-containing protein 2A isoform X2 n=1 Tax=Protopterus annectens TaxID=7888 RepID=UPI001CFBA2A1|nr:PWWP domain-containing protein 2A isoform X2 [Protopterus annectens]
MAAVAAEAAATAASPGDGGEAEPELGPTPGREAGADPTPVTMADVAEPQLPESDFTPVLEVEPLPQSTATAADRGPDDDSRSTETETEASVKKVGTCIGLEALLPEPRIESTPVVAEQVMEVEEKVEEVTMVMDSPATDAPSPLPLGAEKATGEPTDSSVMEVVVTEQESVMETEQESAAVKQKTDVVADKEIALVTEQETAVVTDRETVLITEQETAVVTGKEAVITEKEAVLVTAQEAGTVTEKGVLLTARETVTESEASVLVTVAQETEAITETEASVLATVAQETETEASVLVTVAQETETEASVLVTVAQETEAITETEASVLVTVAQETEAATATEAVLVTVAQETEAATAAQETEAATATEAVLVTVDQETEAVTATEAVLVTEQTAVITETDQHSFSEQAVIVTEKEAVLVTEQEAPVVTEKEAVLVTEQETAIVTEKEAVLVTEHEQEAVVIKENEAMLVTEQEAAIVTEIEAMLVTEQEAALVKENEAMLVTEQEAAALVKENEAVLVTEQAAVVTEKEAVLVTEQAAVVTEKEAVLVAEQAAVVTEKEAVLVAEQAAVVTEKEAVLVAEQAAVVTEIEAMLVTEQAAVVTEKEAMLVTEQAAVVTEKEAMLVTEQAAVVTEKEAMLVTEQAAVVTEKEAVLVTEQAAVVTEKEAVLVTEQETAVTKNEAMWVTEQEATVVMETEEEAVLVTERETVVTDKEGVLVTERAAAVVAEQKTGVVTEQEPVVTEKDVVVTETVVLDQQEFVLAPTLEKVLVEDQKDVLATEQETVVVTEKEAVEQEVVGITEQDITVVKEQETVLTDQVTEINLTETTMVEPGQSLETFVSEFRGDVLLEPGVTADSFPVTEEPMETASAVEECSSFSPWAPSEAVTDGPAQKDHTGKDDSTKAEESPCFSLMPGTQVLVTLDHIIQDAVVVSFRVGERIFSGVLMDVSRRMDGAFPQTPCASVYTVLCVHVMQTRKRTAFSFLLWFGPYGIPVTVFPKREHKDKPETLQLPSKTFQQESPPEKWESKDASHEDASQNPSSESCRVKSCWTSQTPPLFHEGAPYPPPLFIRDTYSLSLPQPPPRKIKRPKRKLYREEPPSIMNAIRLRPRQVLCDRCKNNMVADKKEIRRGGSTTDPSRYEDSRKRRCENVPTVNKRFKTDQKGDAKGQNESQKRTVVKVSNIAHNKGKVIQKVSSQANSSKGQLSTKKVLQSKNVDHTKVREMFRMARKNAQKKRQETSVSKNAIPKGHLTRRLQNSSSGSLPPRLRLKPQRYRNEENDSSYRSGLDKLRSSKTPVSPTSRCISSRSAGEDSPETPNSPKGPKEASSAGEAPKEMQNPPNGPEEVSIEHIENCVPDEQEEQLPVGKNEKGNITLYMTIKQSKSESSNASVCSSDSTDDLKSSNSECSSTETFDFPPGSMHAPSTSSSSSSSKEEKKIASSLKRVFSKNVSKCITPDGRTICVGDIVWAKIYGFPWWPARILAITVSRKDNGLLVRQEARISWFGSPTTSFLALSQMSPFLDNFHLRFNKKRRGLYRKAITEAAKAAKQLTPEVRALLTQFET